MIIVSRLDVMIKVNGNPLRRAYVEHLVFGFGAGMYITNDDGRVKDDDNILGIKSDTSHADIRIWCQNSVVRVLDGNAFNIAVSQVKNIHDGSTVDLNTNAEQDDYYAILNRCLLVYDIVFRQFRPYSHSADPDFPLGRKSTLSETKDRRKRIEVSYPSHSLLDGMAYTDPKSDSTGYPLIHLRDRSDDGALFGENSIPIRIPAEMAHGLHFARFPSASGRQLIKDDYVGWMTNEIDNGRSGRHGQNTSTSPVVAFLEALDLFSTEFAEYVRGIVQGHTSTLLRPQEMTPQIRRSFLSFQADSGGLASTSVARLDSAGNIAPLSGLTLDDTCEGAIYGCIFLDFGRRVGLLSAVNAYLRSTAMGARTFDDYKTWIADTRPRLVPELDAARRTWGL